ncbi:MAG: alpha/beta fold hydrolase [Acholeplasmataceae bacterium]|jgi:pimeloyl-ACP methyl ester carboxylesterase
MKKLIKYILAFSLVITSVFGLVGCSGDPELSVESDQVLVKIGEEATINLTINPKKVDYTISVDRSDVATATKDGPTIKVKGVAAGRAVLTVTHKNENVMPLYINIGVITPEIDLTYQKKNIELSNGETYAYLEENPQATKTVLLLHGNLSSSVYWLRAIKELKTKYHVLAPDFRGFGDSTHNTRITSFADLVDDVVLFMNAKNVSKAYVIGWSMGGGVAMELAAAHPALVEKLVLVASTTHKGYPTYSVNGLTGEKSAFKSAEDMANDIAIGAGLEIFKANDRATMKESLVNLSFNPIPDAELDLYVAEAFKQKNLLDANWALSTQNMSAEASLYSPGANTIKNITCPVLHLWGKKDDILAPKAMTDDNYNALQSVSERIDYDDCGHMIFLDKYLEAVQDIITFLDR